MKIVIRNLIWLLASIGLYAVIALVLRDTNFAESGSFASQLAGLGVVLLGVPVVALLGSVFALGVEKQRSVLLDDVSAATLRLPAGVKWGGVIMCAGLWVGVVAALWLQNEPRGTWLVTLPVQLLCLYGMLAFWLLQAHFDQRILVVMGWTLRSKTYDWSAVQALSFNEVTQEVVLTFAGNRRARVSAYLSDLNLLIDYANRRLEGPEAA